MSISKNELRDITREFFKQALLNSSSEVISENNNKKQLLKEVSMTADEMESDITRWADEISELEEAVATGNVETPDMGGLNASQGEHEEVAKWLGEAVHALGMAMNIVSRSGY